MGIFDGIKKIFGGGAAEQTQATTTEETRPQRSPDEIYIESIEADRYYKDQAFRSPQSPVADWRNFKGLDYYPPDPAYRYALPLIAADNPEEILTFQTSTGDDQEFYRIGTIDFDVEGQQATLAVYRATTHDGLFLPFRDATSGTETYGAGRYLDPHELGGGELLVDFNQCYNPFCAYSSDFSCPLPPFENHLKIPVRAGEKEFEK
ncbi:MAG: DUF1684 domain-containing protein [Chloroflexota bacterium]